MITLKMKEKYDVENRHFFNNLKENYFDFFPFNNSLNATFLLPLSNSAIRLAPCLAIVNPFKIQITPFSLNFYHLQLGI